jgi:2',3'-cyclic-nucleotide 2'-phosphodiesterase (5'-nucleotidase family)
VSAEAVSRRDFARWVSLASAGMVLPGSAGASEPDAFALEPFHRERSAPRVHGARTLTLLYTNDFHSAFEPVPAFWLPGRPRVGGASHLAALVARERAAAPGAFLLDSGDMFTGTLSRLTEGEALLEMMLVMGYDVMGVGNHEFDYGWQPFERGMARVPFPVVCANVRYRGNGVRFTRPHTIVERDGVRLGVIGVMGMKAATRTIMPSKVAELEFTDPAEAVRASVRDLRDAVDLIVVLGHQGLPGPMQSDAEADPTVQRLLDEDLALCAAVPGIDVYIAAHSHHGLEQPIVHPDTGSLIVQTYGYGTRLGRLQLAIDTARPAGKRIVGHTGELLLVDSDRLPAHPGVAARVAHYRGRVADQIGAPLGRNAVRMTRRYHHDSLLGAYVADLLRDDGAAATSARDPHVGITNAGGLRADLPEGAIDRGHVLDALPFLNDAVTVAMSGGALRALLEQGCSLEAGMVQASGVRVVYDPARPIGTRIREVTVQGAPLDVSKRYLVSTNSFLAEGGDGYVSFREGEVVRRGPVLSELVLTDLRRRGTIAPPSLGRMVPV